MASKPLGAPTRPTGTVAFLFTDVEASVARWEKHPEAMRAAIERHDTLLCASIEAGGGYVFKTVGDAVCAAFPTADAAVRAAVEGQRIIRDEDWSEIDGLRVRMAVHSGAAESREGDYFGQTVNRVSRLLSLAHGDQVVVSGIAKELCEGALPSGVTLRDLGAHRLRDLAYPEQVYQVIAPDLPATFPPLRSLGALPNNLPLQLTPFLGRETETGEIENALEEARLVTLVGSGGVGKTRLSLQAGANALDAFDQGVWFVDLAVLRAGDQVPRAIAEVLGVQIDPASEPLAAIIAAFRSKNLLLILDNCEHVVADAAAAADRILRGCPQLRILATSREGLGISGERIIRVPSLSIPPAGRVLSLAAAVRFGAVALFVDRAQAANADFSLTAENLGTVIEICRRLDGIALAIELAAARLKMLSVDQLASRLNERFRILTGGSRTALARQQTMRALIDWSYDLLSEPERALFRRSAVFAGSFSLDAVARVCATPGDGWDSFDVLAALVDKSMVASEFAGSEQRYRLLESARQYALERLTASGEEHGVRDRHAEFFRDAIADGEQRYFTTPLKVWLSSVDPDAGNLRAAQQWTLEQNDWETAAAIASASLWYWSHSRQPAAPIAALRRILEHGESIAPVLRARCWYALSYLLGPGDEKNAREAAHKAREIAEREQDEAAIAHALVCEASAAFMDYSYDCDTNFARALDIFTGLGNQRMAGFVLGRYARSLGVRSRLEEAMPRYERALSMSRIAGDDRTCAQVLNNLAEAAFNTDRPEVALRYAGEALEYAAAARLEAMMRFTYANMVIYLIKLGMVDDALDRARIALQLARETQSAGSLSLLALHFAGIALERGNLEESAILLGHYMPAFRSIYGADRDLERTERNFYARVDERLRSELGTQRFDQALAAGAAITIDELLQRMLAIS
ncbi:MAG TPA: adenylate/guanylate cyclase domain-containing protein [Candidatus Baltobacteraceae bacterium]